MIEQTYNSEEDLKSIAGAVMSLEKEGVSELENIAETLSAITLKGENELLPVFSDVSEKVQGYIELMLTGVEKEKEPLEEGILLLRALDRSIRNNSEFVFEVDPIINILGNDSGGTTRSIDDDSTSGEIKTKLDAVIRKAAGLSNGDIPGFGQLLNELETIETLAQGAVYSPFSIVSAASRNYLERIILEEENDFELFNEGLFMMQAMVRSIIKKEPFGFDTEDMIKQLGYDVGKAASEPSATDDSPSIISKPVTDLEEEDVAILSDFIIESRDNLESIEVNLIDLEQTPDDSEIINAIFRPFHTIKGVSGFLDLRKINALSHSTENLLDSARNGECLIDHEVTDVILQSVDVLKQLIDRVDSGVQIGKSADDMDLEIDDLVKRIEAINSGISIKDKPPRVMGEILVDKGVVDKQDLSEALDYQKDHPDKKIGEILVEENKVESKEVISALREQKRGKRVSIPQVKVDTNKLDNLVDLTGELVIAQSMLRQNADSVSTEKQKLNQNLNQLGQIVSNIQKIAMSMRMVPINATFQKMVRLVRDLAKNCKKEVSLEMSGEDTEIDRNVVEALYEPMVHMIRNSIDHGLESVEERQSTGKPAKGKVSLSAYHKGGNIVIEISDDGKGLNQFNILEKAMNSGLIDPDANLTDSEIFQLIMEPGFSTAKEITDISGRGVGMDVVKKAIESLNGRVDIQSEEGKGSTFTISLPLTLAIIEGMLVRVGGERFIVPTMAILESLKPVKEDYYTVEGKGEMLMFRGNLIPVVRLNLICGVEMDHENVWDNIVIVVENKDEQKGILIDELLGKEEFVIKSLGETLKGIKGLAGGAILGDGRVGLILDIAGLFDVSLNY